jgi:hypothetical protein
MAKPTIIENKYVTALVNTINSNKDNSPMLTINGLVPNKA